MAYLGNGLGLRRHKLKFLRPEKSYQFAIECRCLALLVLFGCQACRTSSPTLMIESEGAALTSSPTLKKSTILNNQTQTFIF